MHPAITQVAELRGSGLSRREIRQQTQHLTRLCVGSYAPQQPDEQAEHLLRAVALVERLDGMVASHTTAAITHGLPARDAFFAAVHLSPTRERRGNPKSGPGYRTHPRRVDPEAVAVVGGLQATDALTTVLDCARLLDPDWGVVIADAASHQMLVSVDTLVTAASQVTGLRGAGRARALVGRVSAKSESPGETLARLRLLSFGLDCEEQIVLTDVPGNPRVDFLIDGWLVIEFDGQSKYALSGDVGRAHWEEKLRHDRIVEAGYEVLRLTWADLWDDARLKERIDRALRRARLRRRGPS